MKKSLFIHIGYGKTGTSSAQSALFENRDRLMRRGVLYPLSGLAGTGHHALAELEKKQISPEVSQLYQALIEEISRSDADRVIISSEYLCFLSGSYVKEVAELLREFDVRIVFYVRNQVKLVKSTFLQWQKMGDNYGDGIESFYSLHRDSFDFLKRVEPWERAFGRSRIIARLYDTRLIGDDTGLDLLRLLRVHRLREYVSKRDNTSLISEFSKLVSLVDTFGLSSAQREAFIAELLLVSDAFKKHSAHPLMGSGMYPLIQQMHQQSNQEFAQRYLPPDHADLFLASPVDEE
jgi:hypothetical protein